MFLKEIWSSLLLHILFFFWNTILQRSAFSVVSLSFFSVLWSRPLYFVYLLDNSLELSSKLLFTFFILTQDPGAHRQGDSKTLSMLKLEFLPVNSGKKGEEKQKWNALLYNMYYCKAVRQIQEKKQINRRTFQMWFLICYNKSVGSRDF